MGKVKRVLTNTHYCRQVMEVIKLKDEQKNFRISTT